MYTVVLIRHGESKWNKENKFTGWTDVDLTEQGRHEAQEAGRRLREAGLTFDFAFTNVLTRAVRTLWIVLDELDLMWIPVRRTWRLNEKHYGDLQGKSKSETAQEIGEDKVFLYRRGWDNPPPPIPEDDPRHAKNDPRYHVIPEKEIPATESLREVVDRVKFWWEGEAANHIHRGRKLIITGSHNSLRALVKIIDDMPDEEVPHLNIPTGIPLVYEVDEHLNGIKSYYLASDEEIEQKNAAQKAQGHAH